MDNSVDPAMGVSRGVSGSQVAGSIEDLLKLSRPWDWWRTKLIFHLFAALFLQPNFTIMELIALLCTMAAWAAFGYGLNEVCDQSTDLACYKLNRARGLSNRKIALFLVTTAIVSVLPILVWADNFLALFFVVSGIVLSICYSAPPMRIKERNIWGVITAACAQWMMPVLAIASAVSDNLNILEGALLGLVALMVGVRWMCIHQYQDLENDLLAGVHTLATAGTPMKHLLRQVFALELAVLGAFLLLTWPRSSLAAILFAAWFVAALVTFSRKSAAFDDRLSDYASTPLATYYFVALPVSYGISAMIG